MSHDRKPNDKGFTTRKTNQLAGSRPALPGQHHLREEQYRAEFIANYKPTDRVEMIWIGDLGSVLALIEVRRAQIAGFWQLKLREKTRGILAPNLGHNPNNPSGFPAHYEDCLYSEQDRDIISMYAEGDFQAQYPHSLLGRDRFAVLLGSLSAHDNAQLRLLEQSVNDLGRERDRLFNQLERRRQQAERHEMIKAEARRRAVAAGEVPGDGEILLADERALADLSGEASEPAEGEYPSEDACFEEVDVSSAAVTAQQETVS